MAEEIDLSDKPIALDQNDVACGRHSYTEHVADFGSTSSLAEPHAIARVNTGFAEDKRRSIVVPVHIPDGRAGIEADEVAQSEVLGDKAGGQIPETAGAGQGNVFDIAAIPLTAIKAAARDEFLEAITEHAIKPSLDRIRDDSAVLRIECDIAHFEEIARDDLDQTFVPMVQFLANSVERLIRHGASVQSDPETGCIGADTIGNWNCRGTGDRAGKVRGAKTIVAAIEDEELVFDDPNGARTVEQHIGSSKTNSS